MNLEEYHEQLIQDVHARSGAEKNFTEAVFTESLCEFLIDQAAINQFEYAGYKNSSIGLRVDAWDYNEDLEVLTLMITSFNYNNEIGTITNTEVTRNFKRLQKFFVKSLDNKFTDALEESSPGYDIARFIYERKKSNSISRIQFILLTNLMLSSRVKSFEKTELNNIICNYDIWDISRLFRVETSGKAREDVVIDFQKIIPEGIPCLPAFTGSEEYASYLIVMPGNLVAELYNRYGERLLEQNVRTFLQFRGKVNKGIRNTINTEPEMFFAYNNGITATAEYVATDESHQKIISVKNLQVVNGGQTTASIFTSLRKHKADLSKVYVQVKLTVIQSEKVSSVVPKISEYANTQNKVSAADFFSNHPFHLRIEEISRRLWAPSSEGGLKETHWFYERARGQFANAQANLTPAKKKEFLSQNPRSQMFTKTDLAKFEHSFYMIPHIVSLGAQKNFAKFANEVGKEWEKNEKIFNELYFKNLIAKAIFFRFLDKNIMKQVWYGGYKANIVTYTLAKFAHAISLTGKNIDFVSIWKLQKLNPALERELIGIAEIINDRIQETPEGITNVTEWCKKELCWEKIKSEKITLSKEVLGSLIFDEYYNKMKKDAVKQQKTDNDIVTQNYVYNKGGDYWKKVAKFGLEKSILSPKEMGIIEVACQIPNKIPSEKQSKIVVEIEKKAIREGLQS